MVGAKPDLVKREKLARLRQQNPCATGQQLADLMGVKSREAVRQMLKTMGLKTMSYREPVYCQNCGTKIPNYPPRLFCGCVCRSAFSISEVECDQCHNLFLLPDCELRDRRKRDKLGLLFCSRGCWGSYVAHHYGFCVHPENIGGGRNRKHDYSLIKDLSSRGLTPVMIVEKLGIPRSSVYCILRSLREIDNG